MPKRIFLLLVLAFLFCCGTMYAQQQDVALQSLFQDSKIVARAIIVELQSGVEDEKGVVEWFALARVLKNYKGSFPEGSLVRIRFERYKYRIDERKHPILEPPIIAQGVDGVVFLKGRNGRVRFGEDSGLQPAYDLTDRWVGVVAYTIYVDEQLEKY